MKLGAFDLGLPFPGTSSRRVALGGTIYTIGFLVQANPNVRPWLTILGKPVGKLMPEDAFRSAKMGSIIVILATDAPLPPLSLRHIARRAVIGLGCGGTPRGNSSGDIFLAFSTADTGPMPQEAHHLLARLELNLNTCPPFTLPPSRRSRNRW